MLLSRIAALVALTVFLVPVALSEPVFFKDCGSTVGKPVTVDVSPCSEQPCSLVKGQSYTVNVTFISNEVAASCKALVYGELYHVPVPFPLPEPDGCKSGLSCPLQCSQTYNYVSKLPIKPEYPCLELTVEWELMDDNKNTLFCWKIPVSIVDG